MRPPGRSTLAISASATPGLGISCNMATEVTASTVSSRNGNCWASARKKPTRGPGFGADRAGQHRLGDVDAQRETIRACGASE